MPSLYHITSVTLSCVDVVKGDDDNWFGNKSHGNVTSNPVAVCTSVNGPGMRQKKMEIHEKQSMQKKVDFFFQFHFLAFVYLPHLLLMSKICMHDKISIFCPSPSEKSKLKSYQRDDKRMKICFKPFLTFYIFPVRFWFCHKKLSHVMDIEKKSEINSNKIHHAPFSSRETQTFKLVFFFWERKFCSPFMYKPKDSIPIRIFQFQSKEREKKIGYMKKCLVIWKVKQILFDQCVDPFFIRNCRQISLTHVCNLKDKFREMDKPNSSNPILTVIHFLKRFFFQEGSRFVLN